MADQQVVVEAYLKELWAEYAVGNAFLLLRLVSRYKTVGLRGFALDDYFTGLAMAVWAVYTACAFYALTMPSNVGLTPETAAAVPSDQYATYERGGQVIFVSWISYVAYVWCIKATALSFFARLCAGLPSEMTAVRYVALFTAAGYVASILTQLLGCLPVHHSWQVFPFPGEQCTTRKLNYYIIGTLDLVTDMLCCVLPVPVLIKLQLPTKHKLLLCPLFLSGLFATAASILRSYYSLQSPNQNLQSAFWASREFLAAAATVSIPCLRPLFLKSTSRDSDLVQTMHSGNTTYYGRETGGTSDGYRSVKISGGGQEMHSCGYQEGAARRLSRTLVRGSTRRLPLSESDEDMMLANKGRGWRPGHSDESLRTIQVITEYSVSRVEIWPKHNV
ncbi:uncharacterized protein PG986_006818 [Apiospora aurea]|uniref:Rhodopsin domain-containing protein n=1 Tax=Apiospora aurea TaxID=335848 RepID=A0ABR1QC47_9PEZI